ncbi:MAG: hypothetical protein C0403_06340 [Desulfobacterium sp.]|nr:hypothetical protein [Desulfobacterium sp.]
MSSKSRIKNDCKRKSNRRNYLVSMISFHCHKFRLICIGFQGMIWKTAGSQSCALVLLTTKPGKKIFSN